MQIVNCEFVTTKLPDGQFRHDCINCGTRRVVPSDVLFRNCAMPLLPKDRPKGKKAAEAFLARVEKAAKPAKPRRLAVADLPCIHRGAVLREETCQTCGDRGKPIDIHACAIHGECAVRRWQKQGGKIMASCNACESRSEGS